VEKCHIHHFCCHRHTVHCQRHTVHNSVWYRLYHCLVHLVLFYCVIQFANSCIQCVYTLIQYKYTANTLEYMCIQRYSVYTVSVQLYHAPVYNSMKTYVYRGAYIAYTACIKCIHLYIQCIHLYGIPVRTVYTVSVSWPITSTLPKLCVQNSMSRSIL
jgi:hypothetical protein